MYTIKKCSWLSTCLIVLLFSSQLFTSCDDMLEVNSKRLSSESDFDMKTPADSIYSIVGILAKLQKVADSYVLLGELRGDLLAVNQNSDLDLKEINDFNISSNNPYADIRKYYDIVNNCNYVLQKIDTAVVDRGLKLKLGHYAVIKGIRAWTYMQMALNFKTVKYLEKPILTVADAEKDYSANEVDILQLANKLIADLEPLKRVPYPNIGSMDSYDARFSYIPIRFLLGELYLWRGSLTGNSADYENAASNYRLLMYEMYENGGLTMNGQRDVNRIPTTNSSISYWIPVNNTISQNANLYWTKSFLRGYGEVLTTIACSNATEQNSMLDSLNNQHKIVPTTIALKNWDSQTYYLNEASTTNGDLRKYGSISYNDFTNSNTTAVISDFTFTGAPSANYLIYKYKAYQNNIVICRTSLIYLRYAEAVNRLNKPKLAFAVLKYGLNSSTMINNKIVPASEKGSPVHEYADFNNLRFSNNVGIRMRGLGNMDQDTTFFVIPRLATMADSVLYVEDKIEQELALETAFEGNRFHDLMRINMRRINNGEATTSYLANKIAEKHTINKEAIRTKLMNQDNWYIKR